MKCVFVIGAVSSNSLSYAYLYKLCLCGTVFAFYWEECTWIGNTDSQNEIKLILSALQDPWVGRSKKYMDEGDEKLLQLAVMVGKQSI